MFKNKLYFCFGDFRNRKRRYHIFPVDTVEKAYNVVETLGFKVLVDETSKSDDIRNLEERIAESILHALHEELHSVENTVSCIRRSQTDAEALKQHFMKSNIRDYFPKILDQPVKLDIPQMQAWTKRKMHPWMSKYVIREMQASCHEIPEVIPVYIVENPQKAVFGQDEPMELEMEE